MARSEKELKDLLEEVKEWFHHDMGIPYHMDHISDPIKDILRIRITKFVHRRLDHLPDADIIKFIEVCKKDAIPPPIVPPVVQPKVEVARGKSTKR